MYISFYLKLQEGDHYQIKHPEHPYYGRIVRFKQLEYAMQLPLFVFETLDRERVVASCETQFEALPHPESLRFMIDLALQTRDEAWFRELVHRLQQATQGR
ncbi:IDEAL domain-containing protein [Paenibacillus cremeus]|uniref:IDEAL domain-containing protein n=1 Tax=Paenibacillus cremeus TaxID=2163881 RepID=A0A559K493_9BACL|nr:IDEAL domain-containing protein [Paenibacillus cremeus]TVY06941.1 IDEAL domain-containing protein [Paenibacillus cremeus]